MAEKIRLEIDDATNAGLQSVEQQFAALQARQKKQQDEFVRANAEAFVNAEHEAHERVAADFAAMLERQKKERERFESTTAPVFGPITPEQHAAGEAGRKIANDQRVDEEIRRQANAQIEAERRKAEETIKTIREQQAVAKASRDADIGLQSDTYSFRVDPAAEAAIEKLKAQVEAFNLTLQKGAEASDRLAEELAQVDFPEDDIVAVRALWAEVSKTREAAELAAQTFEKLGQTDAAARIRIGLAETANSARRLKQALETLEVKQLSAEMNAAGTSAKTMASGFTEASDAALRTSLGLEATGRAANRAAGSRSASGTGILQLAYAVDDMQYGLRGVVNNIPLLVQSFGATAAAAGKLAIVAVIIAQIANHWEDLQKLLSNPHGWDIAKDYAEKAMGYVRDTIEANLRAARKGLVDFANSWGLLPDSVKQFSDAEQEALGKSLLASDKLAAQKAKDAAVNKGFAENADAAAKREWQNQLKSLDTLDKLEATAKALRDQLTATPAKGFLPMTAEEAEKTAKRLGEVEAQIDRVKAAKADEAKAQSEADTEAALKRQTDYRNSELTTLDQVRDRLAEIDRLQKGRSTGISGAYDLDEKSAKRLRAEQQQLLDLEATLLKAERERAQENERLAKDVSEKLAEQSQELQKQIRFNTALHEIEKKRSAISSGADDPNAEKQRLQAQANREAFLDRVRAKTEYARQQAEAAQNDENLSDQQKKQRRDAYALAVQNQITAEANARKQAAAEQAKLDFERAEKNAALDREALELKRQAAFAAEVEYQRAKSADAAADSDRSAGAEERRKKATEDLQKATSDKLKAEADVQQQIETNERNRKDTADKNQEAHTRQRIADEIAVGKAREKALLEAAQREQELEDAKRARQQGMLQQEPRVQQAAQQIGQRIKQKDLIQEARKRRQDAAEKAFIQERQRQRKKVKAGDVKQVRDKAGAQFNKDLKKGKADAELAAVGNELFNRMVDQTRGLAQPVANALKAIAAKAAQDIIDAANVNAGAEQVEKAKPGDKAAQRKAEGKAKAEARKKKVEEDEDNERPEVIPLPPPKPIEQVKAEIAANKEAKKKADAEAKAKREQAKRDAEAKEQAKRDIAEANAREAQERVARENETPEQRAAREQKEDDEFRQQRAAEHDADQQRHFEQQTQRGVRPATQPAQQAGDARGQQAASANSAATQRMAGAQDRASEAIVDALNANAQFSTEQANRLNELTAVVNQITDQINQLQQQFITANDSARMRSIAAGAV